MATVLLGAERRPRIPAPRSALNFIVTSNHIHLIVFNDSRPDVIPKSMQLIAGRTGQTYNRRKSRKGAFWEDRYHATAIESGEHLWRCLVYVDLNMVRAGVVSHPAEWKWSGYHEIQKPKKRYRVIDHDKLRHLLDAKVNETFSETHRGWIESQLKNKPERQTFYSESLAVGSEGFTGKVKRSLGLRAIGRRVLHASEAGYQLKESTAMYDSKGDNDKSGSVDTNNPEMNSMLWKQHNSLGS